MQKFILIDIRPKNKRRVQSKKLPSPAYQLSHPTLGRQLHKNEHQQKKDKTVTGNDSYKLPDDWIPPRGTQ